MDIGCGPLRPYSEFLISKFPNYTGGELDERCVRIAQDMTGGRVEIRRGNIEELSFGSGSLSLVVCNDMLAYTNKKKAISEIWRVLKNGGVCISLSNDSIEYSLRKMIWPNKVWPVEVIHSIVVIVNTMFARILKLKFFRTTFNTRKELAELLGEHLLSRKEVWEDRRMRGHRTVNFVFEK